MIEDGIASLRMACPWNLSSNIKRRLSWIWFGVLLLIGVLIDGVVPVVEVGWDGSM
jgi:hypothetical protein